MRPKHDPRLEEIADYAASQPREALLSLDSINPEQLNAKNRAYYNLLLIKARDKAYLRNTSDSLIQTVIDYMSFCYSPPAIIIRYTTENA